VLEKKPLVLLALVIALAAVLRLRGLDRELPHAPEPDSYLVLQTEILRAARAPDMKQSEKGFYAYPLTLASGLALLPEAQASADATLEEHLAVAGADALRGRTLVAWLSLLLIPGTWFLARRFTTTLGALVAALLVATSLLHLEFSQQARHHAPHASFALLAVLSALQLRARPDWVRYLVAASLALLALGMLHSGWFALLPIVVAHLLRSKSGTRAPQWALLAPIFASVLAWFALYPRVDGKLDESASVSEGGHTLYWRDLDFSGTAKSARLLFDYDPGLTVLAALGALMLAVHAHSLWRAASRERRSDMLVVLAYALPYALALGVYKETVDRMLLPLVPFLATLAALAVVGLVGLLPSNVRVLGVALALTVPAFGAVRYASVRDARDTFEQCADWLVENASEGRTLVSSRFNLPLAGDAHALERVKDDHSTRQRRWMRYQLEHGPLPRPRDMLAMPGRLFAVADPEKSKARIGKFLDEEQPQWVVVDISKYMLANPLMKELRDWAARNGSLAATFSGEIAQRTMEPSLDYQDMPRLFARLCSATAFGPTLEVYRIAR